MARRIGNRRRVFHRLRNFNAFVGKAGRGSLNALLRAFAVPVLCLVAEFESHADASASSDALDTFLLDRPTDPRWWHGATIYHIWVRSFYDSDGDGNGDIEGIIQKLDYIEKLGVTAVMLSPIFESPSYHGFDVSDYMVVEKDYGNIHDFKRLLAAAKERNIKVIVDFPVNHVSEYHKWFQSAVKGDKRYKDYFVWSKFLPDGYAKPWAFDGDSGEVWHWYTDVGEWYYGAFSHTQPDLNYKNPEMVSEIRKIAEWWLKLGVDGFRLDAARYLIEEGGIPLQSDTEATHAFWKNFKAWMRTINPDVMLVGENFADKPVNAAYFDAFDLAFDFDFSTVLLSASLRVGGEERAKLRATDYAQRNIADNLIERSEVETAPTYYYSSFIGNHDLPRPSLHLDSSQLGLRGMAGILLTMPGTIFIYYGEEIGMRQADIGKDRYIRSLMQWDRSPSAGFTVGTSRWIDKQRWFRWDSDFAPFWGDYWQQVRGKGETVEDQESDSKSLLNLYRKLISVRERSEVLRMPDSVGVLYNDKGVWFARYCKSQDCLLVISSLRRSSAARIDVPSDLVGEYNDLVSNTKVDIDARHTVQPASLVLLEKRR